MSMDKLIDSLSSQGWYVWDDFMSLQHIQAIKNSIPDTLQDARIGRGDTLQGNKSIRADQTVWLEPEMGEPIIHYLGKMELVRQELNCQLYLGLRDFETHFCRYPNGGFYKKHLDNPRGQGRRKVTTVLYMNEAWQAGDGGELVVYDKENNQLFELEPLAGRMIFFMSEEFPHEVLPTQQKRESIAGWFLTEKIL
ncbi:2OG-Fe(II) oxygenase [Providencia hangzhouensis]|uniref:Predicted proline hydroxylase n=1 Tax=Providencia rettgeri TaxID=587 RepID=A0A9N8D0H4_PRORE|nr:MULTISPECIES: 2OG-Fe(II) oxygenase [Providencia]MBN7841716.1 2OG-Fe(II) oxygenase [Providencia rettgeri]MBN7852496.1 2OG-Fe(II) oxygenase [Providencia rettgeri]MBN7864750.1 2OG-Fe(II) oxygenase [Providencia rettgeri]MBN7874820.1 2OG-Fe(II) oxygenase [Providencia rettgeri]MBN7899296.1 2OG-Fe(II) oxygenase [Providencia rettgeri]